MIFHIFEFTFWQSLKKTLTLTVDVDGSEDESIHCFKKGEPCEAGLERLEATIEFIEQSQVGNPFENITESDVEDAFPEDLIIDHDDVDDDLFDI